MLSLITASKPGILQKSIHYKRQFLVYKVAFNLPIYIQSGLIVCNTQLSLLLNLFEYFLQRLIVAIHAYPLILPVRSVINA